MVKTRWKNRVTTMIKIETRFSVEENEVACNLSKNTSFSVAIVSYLIPVENRIQKHMNKEQGKQDK
jgi:hypothetical protein